MIYYEQEIIELNTEIKRLKYEASFDKQTIEALKRRIKWYEEHS